MRMVSPGRTSPRQTTSYSLPIARRSRRNPKLTRKTHSQAASRRGHPCLMPRRWKYRRPLVDAALACRHGQTLRISTTVLRLRPFRVPSRKASSSRSSGGDDARR